jgi:hypothetical protein
MIGQLVEISIGVLILFLLVRVAAYIRRYSSPEDVMDLIGDALSLKSGTGISKRDG